MIRVFRLITGETIIAEVDNNWLVNEDTDVDFNNWSADDFTVDFINPLAIFMGPDPEDPTKGQLGLAGFVPYAKPDVSGNTIIKKFPRNHILFHLEPIDRLVDQYETITGKPVIAKPARSGLILPKK